MKVCRIVGTQHFHKEIDLPPLTAGLYTAIGRKGAACGASRGVIFQVEVKDGTEKDVTCPECKVVMQDELQ